MIDIQEFLEHPESLDKDSLYELRNLLAHYPYFETVRLLYLKNLYILHDPSFGEELNKSVAYITDRSFLYHYIEGEFRHRSVRKASIADEQNTDEEDRTLSLIDAFLASMPEESNYAAIGNSVATDYASYLLEEKDGEDTELKTPLRGQNRIDKFIEEAERTNFCVLQNEKDWSRLKKSAKESRNVGKDSLRYMINQPKIVELEKKWVNHEELYIPCSDVAELRKNVKEYTSSRDYKHLFVAEVEVGVDTSIFNMPKEVVFVDTPGLKDPVKYRSDITRAYIKKADAVLIAVPTAALTAEGNEIIIKMAE